MDINHANLPSIAQASLPDNYRRAKKMLAACEKLDECKEWADKASALASYAKQAKDPALMNHAIRIQARAIRRTGQLLEAIPASKPGHRPKSGQEPAPTSKRKLAAREAGISPHQQKQAQRLARIPEREFTSKVDDESPITITALADAGKKPANNLPTAKEMQPYLALASLQYLVKEAQKIILNVDFEAFAGLTVYDDCIADELNWLENIIKEIRKCI